jgi:hypothetical protein
LHGSFHSLSVEWGLLKKRAPVVRTGPRRLKETQRHILSFHHGFSVTFSAEHHRQPLPVTIFARSSQIGNINKIIPKIQGMSTMEKAVQLSCTAFG